jgi:hypothetical protein
MGILVAALIAGVFIGAIAILFVFSLKMYRISHAHKKRQRLLAAELMAREAESYHMALRQQQDEQDYGSAPTFTRNDIDAESTISGETDISFRHKAK